MKFSEFWKTYRSEMVKLLTTHFAIAVFSIMCNSIFLVTDYTQTMMFVSVAISVFIFMLKLMSKWEKRPDTFAFSKPDGSDDLDKFSDFISEYEV